MKTEKMDAFLEAVAPRAKPFSVSWQKDGADDVMRVSDHERNKHVDISISDKEYSLTPNDFDDRILRPVMAALKP